MSKKLFKITYKFYGCIWLNKIVTFKNIFALHSAEASSNPNSPPLFVKAFWGETNRSSLSQMLFKISVLKNFANFIGKHQCLKACNVITKILQHRCFPVKFAKFLRTPFLQNTPGGCFWKNPGDLCGSLRGKGMLWSFSTSLS